jgi:hypothetical protein
MEMLDTEKYINISINEKHEEFKINQGQDALSGLIKQMKSKLINLK